jgi:hypothetical protein
MSYYCNICKKDITYEELLYSKNKFGRPLCREHQKSFRETVPKNIEEHEEKTQETPLSTVKETSSSALGGLLKKVAVTTGRAIKKGATTITDTTQKAIHIRRWKEKILLRLDSKMIRQLARENRVHPEFIDHPTDNDYIDAIKNGVPLKDIITFAKRNHVGIRDILNEMEELKIKEDTREMTNDGNAVKDFYDQVVREIKLFQAYGSYNYESPYHMQLLGYLKGKFPSSKIESEKTRVSSRPDITIDGIAIEVKGPTGEKELQTIADKCLRYCPSHPKGMIIVLFDISPTIQFYYDDWYKNIIKTYPDIRIISK